MPSVLETNTILDFISSKPDDPKSDMAMRKLGLDPLALQAWQAAKKIPNDPRSIEAKNMIFNRIANTLPAKQEVNDTVGFVDRFKIKNLIDRDPLLQQKYFSKKGFDARVVDGQVQIRKPGDPQYTAVDPEGIDRFDLFDIFGDALEAAVSTVAGAGAALVSTPLSPVGQLAAASTASGAIASGFETGKQAIAKKMGLREEFNPDQILISGGIGLAAPGASKLASKAAGAVGRYLKESAPVLREGWEEIAKAGQKLGIVPALRQKYDDKMITFLEEGAEKTPTFFVGRGTRKAATERAKAFDDVAEKIVGKYSELDYVGMGEKAKRALVDKVSAMLEPIEATYGKLDTFLKNQKEFVDIDDATKAIAKGLNEFKFDDATQKSLEGVYKKLGMIESIGDIKQLRTVVGKDAAIAYRNGDSLLSKALDDVYDGLSSSRNKSLEQTIIGAKNNLGADKAEAALVALKSVDKQFAEVAGLVKNVFLGRGETTKMGVRRIVENFDEFVKDSDVLKKIVDTQDPKRLEFLRQKMPEAFDTLREGYLAKLAQSTTSGLTGKPSLQTFLNKIVKLPKQTQQIMFGDDYLGTIKNLQTLAQTMPAPLNPSGTAWTMGGYKEYFAREFAALGRAGQLSVLKNMDNMAGFMEKVSSGFNSMAGQASTQFGMRQSFETPRERGFKDLPSSFNLPKNSDNIFAPMPGGL